LAKGDEGGFDKQMIHLDRFSDREIFENIRTLLEKK
jgi:hypothetical protein